MRCLKSCLKQEGSRSSVKPLQRGISFAAEEIRQKEAADRAKEDYIRNYYDPIILRILRRHNLFRWHSGRIREQIAGFILRNIRKKIRYDLFRRVSVYRLGSGSLADQIALDIQLIYAKNSFRAFVNKLYTEEGYRPLFIKRKVKMETDKSRVNRHPLCCTGIGTALIATGGFAVAFDLGRAVNVLALNLKGISSNSLTMSVWIFAVFCAALGAYYLATARSEQRLLLAEQGFFSQRLSPSSERTSGDSFASDDSRFSGDHSEDSLVTVSLGSQDKWR